METSTILIRLACATVLGAVVGLERERKEWVAGLRTHILVTLGGALAMMVSTYGFSDVLGKEGYDLDPSRIAAQVVSGVGFLGAGTIIFLKREVIKGLTTAAAIWSMAIVGLAVGGGMYLAAAATTLLAVFVLAGIKWIEKKWFDRLNIHAVELVLKRDAELELTQIEALLQQNKINIERLTLSYNDHEKTKNILLVLNKLNRRTAVIDALEKLKAQSGIVRIDF